MTDLQTFIDGFGFGISVEKLVNKAYVYMALQGHEVCTVNDRYLEVDGSTYRFIKSRKENRWIAKEF